MHHSISIPAAAELCGVGEPAIRRAFREGRIEMAFQWHVGGDNPITYLNLYSAVRCYGVNRATVDANLKRWVRHAPIVRTPDGREWLIIDRVEPMLFLEGDGDDS